jgi:phage replication O-like protein O
MARPQIEDGHTKIANELLEAIVITYFSPAEHKVFWAIVRRTYGWNKKTDRISYSVLEQMTGLDRRHVGPALKRLIARNIIISNKAGERVVNEYGVQKDYSTWVTTPQSDTDLSNKTVTDISVRTDTDLSNSLTPIQATDDKSNLTPISAPSDTGLEKSDTGIGAKSDTDLSNHKRHKDITKDIIQKKEYGEFTNVFLSDDELLKLNERFGKPKIDDLIEQLSGYMKQSKANEKKYTDHYATLRNWAMRDNRTDKNNGGNNGQTGRDSKVRKVYTPSPNYND